MTVVSSKEFSTNQDKYFDMAVNGNVCIKSGGFLYLRRCGNTFVVQVWKKHISLSA